MLGLNHALARTPTQYPLPPARAHADPAQRRAAALMPPPAREIGELPRPPLVPNGDTLTAERSAHDFSGVRAHTDAQAAGHDRAIDGASFPYGQRPPVASAAQPPRVLIQAKLEVGTVENQLEREADTVAERVMGEPATTAPRVDGVDGVGGCAAERPRVGSTADAPDPRAARSGSD